jgi:hypothetical protein
MELTDDFLNPIQIAVTQVFSFIKLQTGKLDVSSKDHTLSKEVFIYNSLVEYEHVDLLRKEQFYQ